LQEVEENTDINQDQQNLKQVILEAAEEFKLPKDAKNANHWWDDECKRAIQEKNETRKMSNKKNKNKLGNLSTKRANANRICRRKKKE
jgi:hypothetical protein